MSKKHFIKLAAIIAAVEDKNTRANLCSEIGKLCASTNANFNWSTWQAACGC